MTSNYPGIDRPAMDEFVDDLCDSDPLMAITRQLLLEVEQDGEKLGWQHPGVSQLFMITNNAQMKDAYAVPTPAFDSALASVCTRNGGDYGHAFQVLARYCEQLASGEFNHRLPSHVAARLSNRRSESDFLPDLPDGHKFFGFGYRFEAWAVFEEEGEVDQRPSQSPRRKLLRGVSFAARDGLFWNLIRVRGEEPQLQVELPEGEDGMFGDVPNALSRLTNVFAGNPVPIVADGAPRD